MKPSDEEHVEVLTDPNWWNQYRKTQAMYDTREDDENHRRPRLALAVAAIIIFVIIVIGLIEYMDFFFDVGGSKYD